MTIGENIHRLRTERCLTQEELAAALFVSSDLVSKWELNKRRPGYDMLRKIADHFGVSLDDIVSSRDLMYTNLLACVPDGFDTERLTEHLNCFLRRLSPRDADVFVMRYYCFLDTKTIARRIGVSDAGVRVSLSRTRTKLKKYLRRV
ncbi:MAG: helix-turn-helix domain-containing protein [Clostridia bacterium]|nr:helix-turn-helix domain-containing protein [Clostridia bacterium]